MNLARSIKFIGQILFKEHNENVSLLKIIHRMALCYCGSYYVNTEVADLMQSVVIPHVK